ncbi:hypothetical protein [Microcystis aeruginosa]|uniref:hypothetical protein n=1 Tax=Microcystis aeruginosa TaxID=1126 RepID=UPI0018809367|nr:hypothetical protein [Microcystis aeruginosa]MBE8994093.1 hypothetical protein [Microcystis aeruginosa LEGE 91341]
MSRFLERHRRNLSFVTRSAHIPYPLGASVIRRVLMELSLLEGIWQKSYSL